MHTRHGGGVKRGKDIGDKVNRRSDRGQCSRPLFLGKSRK